MNSMHQNGVTTKIFINW